MYGGTGSLPKAGSPLTALAQIPMGWPPGRARWLKISWGTGLNTPAAGLDRAPYGHNQNAMAKASLLHSTITEMNVPWTYCTYEDSACGSIIFGRMAPWDLQSGTFNHRPNVWPRWRIKNDGENKGCGERSSQPGRGVTHPFFLLVPEDRVLWTMFLAEDFTALKILLLFR